jgi:tetratricopeptide (TPR) repeat protein
VYADARTEPLKRLKLLQDNHKVIVNNNVVDGLSREVLLLVQLGRYDEALKICNSRSFPQWEGVDKMYGSYLNSYLLRGYRNLKAGKYKEALKDGLTAMQYPDNMMVAREYRGGRECEVYYFVGTVYEKMGNHAKAMEYWNGGINLRQRDNISEIYFYKAMCLKNAGKPEEAAKIFESLIDVGKAKIEREEVDFFEKFGERQTSDDRKADGHYLMGLGYLGKGMQKEAKQEFSDAAKLNINHIWANKYLSD